MQNVFYSYGGFLLIYFILALTTLVLLIRLGRTPTPDRFPPPGAPDGAVSLPGGGDHALA